MHWLVSHLGLICLKKLLWHLALQTGVGENDLVQSQVKWWKQFFLISHLPPILLEMLKCHRSDISDQQLSELSFIFICLPMPAFYTSYSFRDGRGGIFHDRASVIAPSARQLTRPQLFKVLIWRYCDQSEPKAPGTHGETNPGLTRSRQQSDLSAMYYISLGIFTWTYILHQWELCGQLFANNLNIVLDDKDSNGYQVWSIFVCILCWSRSQFRH